MARTWFTNDDGKVVEFNVPQEVADHITDLWDMIGRSTIAHGRPANINKKKLYLHLVIKSSGCDRNSHIVG